MKHTTTESESSIEITATRIIGYAIYDESLSIYPITVEDMRQDANGRIDFDYDDHDAPTIVLPEPRLCWQVCAERNNIMICVGVSDQPVNKGDWLDRGRKALDDDDARYQKMLVRARAKTEKTGE